MERDHTDQQSELPEQCRVSTEGPVAVVNQPEMCVGIDGLEGSGHAHDAIPVQLAIAYLEARGHTAAVAYLKGITPPRHTAVYPGSARR